MKKRGYLLLVVLLVFTVLTVTSILAQEEELPPTGSSTPLVKYDSIKLGDWSSHLSRMCLPGEDCTEDCDSRSFPPEIGCRMYSADEVDYSDDGCYTNILPPGYNINERYQSTNERFEELSDFYEQVQVSIGLSTFGTTVRFIAFFATLGIAEFMNTITGSLSNDNERAQRYFFESLFNFKVEHGGIICGNDHYWYQCDAAHEGTLYWIEAEFPLEVGATVNRPVLLYECQEKVEGGYAWVHQGTDLDGDSYLSTGGTDGGRDCVDFGPFDESMDCPNVEDYQGKTREEIRDLLKETCNYPSNSLCAICINPSAPEVCGDHINNDCGGGEGRESQIELAGNTPDDCNLFAAGCEQKTMTDVTQVRENIEVDEDAPPGVQHYNAYNKQFSWTPTEDGGYCCGYGGINDLGMPITAPDENKRICLNRNPELVGREGDIPSCDGGGPEDSGEWCWATAADANNKFHIFTIKKPSEPAYDVVSNNNNWYQCKDGEGTKGISAAGAIFNPSDDMDDANRFYCYKEGNRWSWADCRDPEEATGPSMNGIKEREEGDGLFAFPIQNQEEVAVGVETVFVDIGNLYTPFYADGRLDFSGYDPMYFEFYLRFKTLNADVPPDVRLKIQGPQQEGQYVIYYDQPILGSAVNTPLLDANRWIHIKVPLASEMLDVKSIEIRSMTRGNTIEVRNIYLSDGSSRICSGTRSNIAEESSWLTDLDYSSPQSTLSAEKLCNALFDPAYEATVDPSVPYQGKAWLGDYDKVTAPGKNCCGNNENEYYTGISREVDGKQYGCWNSEPIASGSTTMNVEFEVEYTERTSEITYPEVPVDYTLTYLFPGFEETKVASTTVASTESPKQLEQLESDFAEPSTGDRKWGRIKARSGSYAVYDTTFDDIPRSFENFISQVKQQGSIIQITLQESGYSPDIAGGTATFEIGERTDFWIAWIFAKNDVETPLRVSHDDNLGIALANGCNKDRESTGDPYEFKFDASFCKFSTEPAAEEDILNHGETADWLNNERYVYWQDVVNDAAVTLKFKKGWNVLYFILDNDGGESMFFNYYPAFAADGFLENNPSLIYFDSHGPRPVYPTGIKVESTSDSPEFDLNLYDLFHTGDISDEFTNLQGPQKFALLAETSKVEITERPPVQKTSAVIYSCSPSEQSECSYPLPGEPPYTITNKHPNLYELYFVATDESGRPSPPQLVTSINSHFTQPGLIQARKVAQQVVFVNEGEDADEDPAFYGCQAANYIEQAPEGQAEFQNLNYCGSKAGKFCAFSVAQEDRREKFTTINSWSAEPITKVGYQPIDQVEGEINNFYDSVELQLRETGADLPYEPEERKHSASVLPTRNFISNAQFLRSGPVLPHWDIRLVDGTLKPNLRDNLVDDALHSITLAADETLRSEQIAVPANIKLSFSAETTCIPKIKLVDKDGTITMVTETMAFNSGEASYLQVEFQGACTLYSPLLQVVDDLPPVAFNYLHQDYPDGFDARAGAACCPENYCWNGYACVEPMGSSTYLSEHISDGRDYRCIEGEWKYLPLQFDWNRQKWGFCSQPEQCLVLPSTLGGSAEYRASDFYEGHYPACINDKEYIFDNLCNKGNWTSRTKFVATKLLEVGENDDYVLYCADYREALLEFDNRENYLGGEFVQQPQTAPTLAETLSEPTAAAGLATCFNTILDPEGRRLVPEEENTCINNVCVLRFKQGGDFKVALATTVNKDILKEDSFLFALNIPQNRLNQLCTGSGDFVKCDLAGLNIPGDLWYAAKLNATIYGRQGVQLTPNLVDRILHWLAQFVGVPSELSDESAFISRAQNFRDVYLLSIGEKKVRALQEVLSADKQTLLAEYEHFTTPVCDYINNIAVLPEAGTELLEQLSGQQKIICTNDKNTGIQRIEAVAGLDFFWPQLTGRLRAG